MVNYQSFGFRDQNFDFTNLGQHPIYHQNMGAIPSFRLFFCCCCFLFTLLPVAYTKIVLTPFGYRPQECVIEVPHGSTVIPGEGDQLVITTPSTTENAPAEVSYYTAPAHCGDDMQRIYEKRVLRKPVDVEKDIIGDDDVGDPKATNGWLDYVGWYPPQGENSLKSFTATYVVPMDPQNKSGTQVLFYFIGMQDNDSPSALNILQPVLTWGNGYNEWYIKSWVCCPKNITVSSPPVFGLTGGSQFNGIISRESPSTWLVDSNFNGKHTSLNAQVGDYIYNWADVTLEVYSVNNCVDFAMGKAYFNALVLTDSQGQTLSPSWQNLSGATLCGGSIVPNGQNSYVIEHQY